MFMTKEWDKFDKTDPAFIAGMNYQRWLLRKPVEGDKIVLLSKCGNRSESIETTLTMWWDTRSLCSDGFYEYWVDTPTIENISGEFFAEYSTWETR
jgi:hypothetical protein